MSVDPSAPEVQAALRTLTSAANAVERSRRGEQRRERLERLAARVNEDVLELAVDIAHKVNVSAFRMREMAAELRRHADRLDAAASALIGGSAKATTRRRVET